MLILIAILISLVVPLIILAMGRVRLQPGSQWLLGVFGALAVWILLLAARVNLPYQFDLISWYPVNWFPESPGLLVDRYSWPYAMALSTLALAILLTDAARAHELDANAWAATLAMAGLGLLSVLAGNPLTLLLTWAIMDLVETWVLLERVTTSSERERVVISFSVRVAGMLLLLAAQLRAETFGQILNFDQIPEEVSVYLLLASGLRLGVLPPHQPFIKEPPLRRGLGTILRFLPVTASLVLLTRTATVGISEVWQRWVIVFALIAALYSAISWLQARNELDGRPFWILGMATFALLAAAQALPEASLVWGLGIVYSGGLLFLRSVRQRSLIFLPLLSLWMISGLPLSPGAPGMQIFATLDWPLVLFLAVIQGMLLAGYLKFALQTSSEQMEIEPWAWVVYPAGLILLLLTYLGVSLWQWLEGGVVLFQPGWWSSLLVLLALAIMASLYQRRVQLPGKFSTAAQNLFYLNWIYAGFWFLYRIMTRLVGIITRILEGEGGILWALLILILLAAVVIG